MNKIICIIKELIAFLIILSGIPFIIRNFIAKNKATILLYHNPKKKLFAKHLIYLKKKYNVIELRKLIKAIKNKNWNQIPEYPLILTFDDGHKDNFHLFNICKTDNNWTPDNFIKEAINCGVDCSSIKSSLSMVI